MKLVVLMMFFLLSFVFGRRFIRPPVCLGFGAQFPHLQSEGCLALHRLLVVCSGFVREFGKFLFFPEPAEKNNSLFPSDSYVLKERQTPNFGEFSSNTFPLENSGRFERMFFKNSCPHFPMEVSSGIEPMLLAFSSFTIHWRSAARFDETF
ncbi:MAG: hypothetical protein VB082_06325 [Christensenella sp.]|nr:hypothetical protein [Christensenella sp.]